MKRIIIFILMAIIAACLCACGKSEKVSDKESNSQTINQTKEQDTKRMEVGDDMIPITLTIGDKVLNGYLNDTAPVQGLIEQLPLTVTLNDSDNDFCGGNLDIKYSESDIQKGYKNGDLAFWTPANNFVIFVDDEENSAETGNLVILGKITESQEVLDSLEGTINVTIALVQETATANESTTEKEMAGGTTEEDTTTEVNIAENIESIETSADIEGTTQAIEREESEVKEMKIRITVGDRQLTATLENNATTRAIVEQMPMTLHMMDLYGREMCYRYGAYALPTDNMRDDNYAVGDIAYWAPGGSLVILYEQNGEKFSRQHLGHIDSGVEVFKTTGDTDVTFELIN